MKYKIKKFQVENDLAKTGNDFSFFYVFIEAEDYGPLKMPIIISFTDLIKSIGSTDPATETYIKKIRNHIGGYGPKHSRMLEILTEEEFDFMPHIINFVAQEDIGKRIEHEKGILLLTPEEKAAAAKKLEELDDSIDGEAGKKYNDFIEAVDAALHTLTLQYYPELFEMGKEVIDKYRNELAGAARDFSSGIDNILYHNR